MQYRVVHLVHEFVCCIKPRNKRTAPYRVDTVSSGVCLLLFFKTKCSIEKNIQGLQREQASTGRG